MRHQRDDELLKLHSSRSSSSAQQTDAEVLSTAPSSSQLGRRAEDDTAHSRSDTSPTDHTGSPADIPTDSALPPLPSQTSSLQPPPPTPVSNDTIIQPNYTMDSQPEPLCSRPSTPTNPSPNLSPAQSHASLPEDNLDIQLEPGDTHDMFERPTDINEHPAIRLIYLKTARLNTIHGLSVKAANMDLNVSLESLQLDGLEVPSHPKPAKTLETIQRRLGLDIDNFLKRQPICYECYQRYSFDEIASARVDKCFRTGCPGIFWRVKGGERHPVKCIVYT
ncbi:hypothetical protein FRC08_005753 [Ceratobasidium sp. 394]|nr:hypothetical protein FRC08_005753 [Ceratobasidium sp. 394]